MWMRVYVYSINAYTPVNYICIELYALKNYVTLYPINYCILTVFDDIWLCMPLSMYTDVYVFCMYCVYVPGVCMIVSYVFFYLWLFVKRRSNKDVETEKKSVYILTCSAKNNLYFTKLDTFFKTRFFSKKGWNIFSCGKHLHKPPSHFSGQCLQQFSLKFHQIYRKHLHCWLK